MDEGEGLKGARGFVGGWIFEQVSRQHVRDRFDPYGWLINLPIIQMHPDIQPPTQQICQAK